MSKDKITINVDQAFIDWWNKTNIRKDDESLKIVAIYAWNACKEHYKVDEAEV